MSPGPSPSEALWGQRVLGRQPWYRLLRTGLPIHNQPFGPWLGSMRSRAAELVPHDYAAGGSEFLYLPRTGTFKRRKGQTILFDTLSAGHEATGLLPAKWSARCRQMEELKSESISDNVPTVIALLTRETISSGLDDGRFSQVYIRDQVGSTNYTLGSEYGATHYPAPGAVQRFRWTPLWYASGDGGLTRGTTEFARRFLVPGSRNLMKSGNWWYFSSLLGTPSRWRGRFNTSSSGGIEPNDLMPSGPFPPASAGYLTKGNLITNPTSYQRPFSDITVGTWLNHLGGTPLYTDLVSGSSYITTPNSTATATCEIRISGFTFTPFADDTVLIRIRAAMFNATTTSGNFQIDLVEAATIRGTWFHDPNQMVANLSTQTFEFSFQLTASQIAAITDWTNLRVRFTKYTATTSYSLHVTYGAMEHTGRAGAVATRGGWKGSDRFYFAVAYQFEDGSIWMPTTPRGPNDLLPAGHNLFTVDPLAVAADYDKITWFVPPGPPGTRRKVLMRTLKIDSTVDSTLQLDPTDLRAVWSIDNNVTTWDDYYADDLSLTKDFDQLLIHVTDYIMTPPTRYLTGGASRAAASYGGLSPCAITLAPCGRTADWDLCSAAVDAATLYAQNSSYMRIEALADGTMQMVLCQSTGTVLTKLTLPFATYTTLQKLVDRINATSIAADGVQWRASPCPGAGMEVATSYLTPHYRTTGLVCNTTLNSANLTGVPNANLIAVGTVVKHASYPAGTYVTKINSTSSLALSNVATATAVTQAVEFYFDLGDSPASGEIGWERVIAPCRQSFLYYTNTYLSQFPTEKSSVWMTIASPGATHAAPNCWSARSGNKHRPPNEDAGISMGVRALDNGFVTPFSKKRAVIRNIRDQGTGVDQDYRMFVTSEASGCIAWGSLCSANGAVLMMAPEGWIGCDLRGEHLLSEAIWLHAPTPTGDFTYEAPLCQAASGVDDDTAWLMARVLKGALRVNYRVSGSHPNRQVIYDFSSGTENGGLGSLVRKKDLPWGWSEPLLRSFTAMVEITRSDGTHLYGWNEQNQGATGDGRIDEMDVTDADNGTAISGEVDLPIFRAGDNLIAGHEIVAEHTTPSGATVELDWVRGWNADSYALTPSTAAVAVRDLKMLSLPARAAAPCFQLKWKQSAGGASELKRLTARYKILPSYQ